MSNDALSTLSAAIERAKERAAEVARQPVIPVVDSPHDVMARRLLKQWLAVISPALLESAQLLQSAGYKVSTELPSEYTEGTFKIEVPDRNGWWHPGFRVSSLQDGSAVQVVATRGEVKKNQPLNKVLQPEEITSEFIAALVTDIVDNGL